MKRKRGSGIVFVYVALLLIGTAALVFFGLYGVLIPLLVFVPWLIARELSSPHRAAGVLFVLACLGLLLTAALRFALPTLRLQSLDLLGLLYALVLVPTAVIALIYR
ncbi:MAG: hypothetical protein LC737_09970, partial [Chloroflexi bacterium]|nr:hypothetical protein [Chloroflexota bacterium]